MKNRVLQLDFIKGILIILVVTFHLSLIVQTYPKVSDIVYIFHIPAFLIISGYLSNIEKDFKTFLKGLSKLVTPYLIFESIYILSITYIGKLLNASNSIDNLNIIDFIRRILIDPIGIYWYIHTLIISTIVYYATFKILKFKDYNGYICMGIILFLICTITGLEFRNFIYYLIGVIIMRSGKNFIQMITPSALSIIPLLLLLYHGKSYSRDSIEGILITLMVISLLLFIYNLFPSNSKIKNFISFLGKNSLSIVYFSPLFTITVKLFNSLFSFDKTAIVFLLFAITYVVGFSLLSAYIMDKLGLTKLIFLRDKIYIK